MIIQTTFSPVTTPPEPHGAAPDGAKPAVAAQAPASTPPSKQQVEAAVAAINRSLQPSDHSLSFSVDQKSDRIVVKVVDSESGKTLRQIPSDEVLAIAESIDRYQKGLILNQKA
jgi:flagellar protein FlaG